MIFERKALRVRLLLRVSAPVPSESCCFFQAEDGIRDLTVTGVQTCALPISVVAAPDGSTAIWHCRQRKCTASRSASSSTRTTPARRSRWRARCAKGMSPTLSVINPSARLAVRSSRTGDRKSTRLNSSHSQISYAVFCLKKKKEDRPSRSRGHIDVNVGPRQQSGDAVCMDLDRDADLLRCEVPECWSCSPRLSHCR